MRLADHVVEKLLALVQDRGLQPGQKLPAERQLAEELGVSRTAGGEANQKLTSQGVLSARRGDGTYVQQSNKPAEWLQEAMVPLAGLINIRTTDPRPERELRTEVTAGEDGMAGVALIIGLGCHWGRSKNLMIVPITVGFVICLPPSATSDRATDALLLGAATLAAALWGTLAGSLLGRASHKPPHKPEVWARTWSYAIVLAILTGVAAGISVGIAWGHAGAWFIMTVVLVFQPYLQDAFQRTWQRGAGTVIGVLLAFLIHLVVPWSTAELILGEVFLIGSILVISTGKYPYWFFTSLITPAMVLLAGSSGNFVATDGARLLATFAGVGLAFVAELLLAPLYRAGAKKHNLERF